ncbi:MAG: hypothetical protein EA427_07975 [Spirochaetaceae bacterium]|nr:MAG: hypothetical protein EA427_07975 [Spirochaetaceae bacterium]
MKKKKVRIPRRWLLPLLTLLVFLVPPLLGAQGLDFLPREVRERIDEVESARSAWESQRTRVINQLEVQPWEEEEEFARRVDRAVTRGAGREYRFLQFQLAELEQYTFSVDHDRITLLPEERPNPGRTWTIEVRTDLGFLPEEDHFFLNLEPVDRQGGRADHYELARAIENNALRGRLVYSLSGHPDGSYQITLKRLYLSDTARPGPAFRTAPVNRYYAFSRYEGIAVVQPAIRHAFLDGRIPEEFVMSGDEPWTVVSDHAYSGDYVLRAGEIGHDMYSEVRLPLAVPTGAVAARISFALRTSSERRYDFLSFSIDNRVMDEWSGPGDWIPVSYEIEPAGTTELELRWRYEKDGSVSEGEDTAWIDDIRIEFE